MLKVDLTITISIIITICAIISPIITTLLNNHHLYKMKKLEVKLDAEKSAYFYKRGVYEDYLKYTGQYIIVRDTDTSLKYGSIYPLALIYFPTNLVNEIININYEINELRWDTAMDCLNTIAPIIREILQSM
jgi:hypothetical protein